MKNKWVVGAFYTIGTPYEQVLKDHLIYSLEALDLQDKLIVKEATNFNSWNRNVAEKPKVILEILNELPNDTNLVFLDADASIEKYPTSFDTMSDFVDIAFHILNWNDWYGYNTQPPEMELLSGTMYFKNTDRVKQLCKEWYQEAVGSAEWEQKVLQRILPKYPDLVKNILPIEYCYMKSRPGGKPPLIKCEPVILHHQVSRSLKREIGK